MPEKQLSLFQATFDGYHITKPIRLIEFFAGYGSQSLAMSYLGLDYESWRICEWNYKSFEAYKLLHTNDETDYSYGKSLEEIKSFLFEKGISADWNKPMSAKQIRSLKEAEARAIYNAIFATKNLVDISRVCANDLQIEPEGSRKHQYVVTYSFPCQDLSLAGNRKLMKEGSGTRSSLLWQFARILGELAKACQRPDMLLMENVPQVHGKGARNDFDSWIQALESMGYSNYYEDLNADEYGVPQNRDRCFMVSILGDYSYEFPRKFPLEYRLKNLLVKKAPEKYYLTEKQMKNIVLWNNTPNRMDGKEKDSAGTLTTHAGRNDYDCNYIPIKEATKKGFKEAEDGDGVYISNIEKKRGTVQDGKIQTIKTSPDVGVVAKDEDGSKD